jgi:BTB And C-terminal Kelch
LQKVAQQCDAVISSDDWLLASKESVMEILSANWLKVRDESALFAALVQWGEHQVKSRGEEESAEATRAEVNDLLPLIRFRTLTAAQFAELSDLACSRILSDNEKLALFRSLSTDKESQMPPGFSLQSESRQSDELALLRTHLIEFKPRVNRPRPLDEDPDPLETRFSISALDSDIGVCYYLCGVSLYSLDYMNEGRPVDVKFHCRHGQSVLGSGSFAAGANEVRGAEAPVCLFDRPVLLSSGLTYVISVKHLARPWTVANLMNEGKYCFCANVNGDLVQVGRMGDVYRLVMKYAGMLEQEYATLDVSRSESVLMPST